MTATAGPTTIDPASGVIPRRDSERSAHPWRKPPEARDRLVPIGEGQAADTEVGTEPVAQFDQRLRLLVLQGLVIETPGRSRETPERKGLALAPAAIDDADAEAGGRVRDEGRQLRLLRLPVEQVGRPVRRCAHAAKITRLTLYNSTLC